MRSFPWSLGALLLGCALDHPSDWMPPEAGPATRGRPRPDAGTDAALATPFAPRDTAQAEAGATQPSAPDASAEAPEETCNGRDDDLDGKLDEGCVMRLELDDTNRPTDLYDTPLQLDGDRLIWGHTDTEDYQGQLWTVKLPSGAPELLFAHDPSSPVRASHDGDRVVYSDYDQFGFTLLDLRDGSRQLIKPLDPAGYNLMTTSLEGRYFAYSQDMRGGCGWCEDRAIFLQDLETGQTQLVEGDPYIQSRPRISGGQLIWMDDRHGHHTDAFGLDHRSDVMAVALPYVPGGLRRLTQAPPDTMWVIAFEGGRALMERSTTYESPPPSELQPMRLLDVAGGTDLPLAALLPLGDRALDLSASHMLVRRDPLGRCHLDLVELATQRSTELDTQGECPSTALIDGDYLVWTRTLASATDVFWMDIGDLDAAQ